MDAVLPAKHAKEREKFILQDLRNRRRIPTLTPLASFSVFSGHIYYESNRYAWAEQIRRAHDVQVLKELTMDEVLPAKHAKEREKKSEMSDLLLKDECYAIMGACFAVYAEKGCGFLEPVYQECMEIELSYRKVSACPKPPISLSYRGITLRQGYEPDFICYDKVVVELKAVEDIADTHRAQVLNYLNATDLELGLLVNFGHYPRLEWERIVRTRSKRSQSLKKNSNSDSFRVL
jgi:GxxExxY protein